MRTDIGEYRIEHGGGEAPGLRVVAADVITIEQNGAALKPEVQTDVQRVTRERREAMHERHRAARGHQRTKSERAESQERTEAERGGEQ
mgnify:CR=1 FL=1